MQSSFEAHASEETLEAYSEGALSEAELASLEEHLLVCPHCQDRLAETDAFIRATREAARELQAASAGAGLLGKLNLPNRIWVSALAGVAVALSVLGWWNLRREAGTPPVAVAVQSLRGGEGLPGSLAPSGRPLLLRLDVNGVPESDGYELEVVSAQGRAVQRATFRRTGASPEVGLSKLEPGQYWIRLYGRPRRELLREFGLRVQ